MSAEIRLQEIAEQIDALSDSFSAYLNRETGELYWLDEENDFARFADDEVDVDLDMLPEWQQQALAQSREVLDSDQWIRLPDKSEVHEWSIMKDFALSHPDARERDELLRALRGKGAFRYFKDKIHQYGIQEQWYRFKTETIENLVAERLDEHGIRSMREVGNES